MHIWVDADACPKIARELITKTAMRTQTKTTFVANQALHLTPSPFINMKVVAQGFDVADNVIIENCTRGDLIITNDIPLADEGINEGAKVMSFKGMIYTKDNIKQSLNMRDFMDTMRGTGVLNPTEMGGQKPYSDKDKKAFADGLNKLVR
ncbi:YaiI/YqxD family protein [Psychrobacter sp. HD31]|uniref:YaiI/YqxD family protein n=1 Tax=Psychrobacter sp. HD31 TaxID=3112003 RepID=UPI003DA398A5